MLAKISSFVLIGLEGYHVDVEADVSNGLPAFDIVGLPDASVKESKERVRSAIKNSKRMFPPKKITVNLAPADIKKEGSVLDLSIAVCLLKAYGGQLSCEDFSDTVFLGELSLDGSLRSVTGILPIIISASEKGYKKFIIPKANAKEASFVPGVEVYAFDCLDEVANHINGIGIIEPVPLSDYSGVKRAGAYSMDMSLVKGQAAAKRALEVAVSGGHNMLMTGPPGTGKTMLAKCIPTIMPDMSFEEALEVTKIHSVAGCLDGDGIVWKRPFRSPHHTATTVAMTGGGQSVRPGEISLSHKGVLFLDELPEYKRSSLEALRQPLEDRTITISRANSSVNYPADFIMVSSMNPCPCGNYGVPNRVCNCTSAQIHRYRSRLSGPLLDRIDIKVEVDNVTYSDLSEKKDGESSFEVKKRVDLARAVQRERLISDGILTNAQMGEREIKKYCTLTPECEKVLEYSFSILNLSARARSRILKVARTIADLSGSKDILREHLLEAIGYRNVDNLRD